MTGPNERIVDHTFAQWVRRRSGSDVLARAAFAASRDEGQGHSCAALLDDDIDLRTLRTLAWVGDGSAFTPFVLSDAGNFYLWRNWRHETRLADALRARVGARTSPVDVARLAAVIAELFSNTDLDATRLQRAAVAAVPGSRVFVLTGGPGTGKTATVLRMALMVLRHASACGFGERPTIALAAPTGKAAQRLAQSIAAGKIDLLQRLPAQSAFRDLLDRVPHAQAQTLHRLLDYRPHDNSFGRGVDSPLAADIVIVDETSMVDLSMMRQLFDAVRADATIILLGDSAQLYAVEAGSVLGDIVASSAVLKDHVITLQHVWRAEAGLHESLGALRAGDSNWCDTLIREGRTGTVEWRACADERAVRTNIEQWIESNRDAYTSIMQPGIDAATALRQLRSCQIVCALREGAFGSHGVNASMLAAMSKRFGFDATGEWHHGRPIIITRNDYARDLYNGDVGIALRDGSSMRVWFESRDRDGAPQLRGFSTRSLPAHEPAWAITIHRSQGSEYGAVAVVLPPQQDHRILSRELVYTAMSRATRSVQLWSTADSLRSAVAQPIHRRGGLRERLR
ncbi:MAG: exodeoxyribonuclease V subunit alpha [Rudaea sp.]